MEKAAFLTNSETVFRTHSKKDFLEFYNKMDVNKKCKILTAIRSPFEMVPSFFFEKNRDYTKIGGCYQKNVTEKYYSFLFNLKKNYLNFFSFAAVVFLIENGNMNEKNISQLKKAPLHFTFQKGSGPKCETLILNMDYVKLWPKYLGDFLGNHINLKDHKTWKSRKELCPYLVKEIDFVYSHPNINIIYPLLTNSGKKIWDFYGNF